MNQDIKLVLKSELLWWGVTLLLSLAVLYPIYASNCSYPFWRSNIVFALVFLTFARYTFLLAHTPLRYAQWAKAFVFVACIPLTVYLIRELHSFQIFADEIGIQSLFVNMTDKDQSRMVEYTKTEMTFLGVGSIVATIIMPIRMLISFWRTHNLGTT